MLTQLISEDEFVSKAQKIPLQKIQWDLAKQKNVDVLVRRDDLIDEHLSGNKFYKLFYNLHAAKASGYRQLLSFGGAYSNHIYALAAAANRYGFKAVGVIRGERPRQLSATLIDAEAWGMKLHFVSRTDYREYREKDSQALYEALKNEYGDFFEIPEGGSNSYGVMGAKVLGEAIYHQVKYDYTSVCLACGTASSLAGVAAGLYQKTDANINVGNVLGFSVLKESRGSEANLGQQVIKHQTAIDDETPNWRLINGFHGGGYGKRLPVDMRRFMLEFEQESGVQLDPVYTVKMGWGVKQLLTQNYWPRGSRLVLVHTGGLQGRRGFKF